MSACSALRWSSHFSSVFEIRTESKLNNYARKFGGNDFNSDLINELSSQFGMQTSGVSNCFCRMTMVHTSAPKFTAYISFSCIDVRFKVDAGSVVTFSAPFRIRVDTTCVNELYRYQCVGLSLPCDLESFPRLSMYQETMSAKHGTSMENYFRFPVAAMENGRNRLGQPQIFGIYRDISSIGITANSRPNNYAAVAGWKLICFDIEPAKAGGVQLHPLFTPLRFSWITRIPVGI